MNRQLWAWWAGREGHSRHTELQRKRRGDAKVLPKVQGKGLGTQHFPKALGGILLPISPRGQAGERGRVTTCGPQTCLVAQ